MFVSWRNFCTSRRWSLVSLISCLLSPLPFLFLETPKAVQESCSTCIHILSINIYTTVCMLSRVWLFADCKDLDCSPPGSSLHGIFQSRILEWVAISFSSDFHSYQTGKCLQMCSETVNWTKSLCAKRERKGELVRKLAPPHLSPWSSSDSTGNVQKSTLHKKTFYETCITAAIMFYFSEGFISHLPQIGCGAGM